jgi:hypothetical protein
MLPGRRVSMFDDEAGPPQKGPTSRGLILKLSKDGRRATVDKQYVRPEDTSAQSEGSLQTLPGGSLFAGFGAQPFFSQWTAAGRLLFDGSLPVDDGSYRVYRFPWSGDPKTLPAAAAVSDSPGTATVYASWNGATDVHKWQILGGIDADSLQPLETVKKRGFETRTDVDTSDDTFAVRALGPGGKVLATSSATTTQCKTKSVPTSC